MRKKQPVEEAKKGMFGYISKIYGAVMLFLYLCETHTHTHM